MAGKSRINVFEIASRASMASAEIINIPDIALELMNHESSASTNAHRISNISGLDYALSNKADASHTHTITNVTGLQSALDGKSPANHAHAIANISGLQTTLDSKQNIINGYTGTIDIIVSVDFVNQTFQTAQINVSNGIITKIN